MNDEWLFAGNITDQIDFGGPEVGVPDAQSVFWGFWRIHGRILRIDDGIDLLIEMNKKKRDGRYQK